MVRFLWLFCSVFLGTSHASLIRVPSPVLIRVKIDKFTSKVQLRGYDLQLNEIESSGFRKSYLPNQLSEWELECSEHHLKMNPLRAQPGQKSLVFQGPVLIQTPGGFLNYQHKIYRGELKIYPSSQGCQVVNVVDLEKYLEALINSEFSSKWNEESIAAQVIAARTYAYHQMREARKRKAPFDVEASIKDQVYDGFSKEDYQSFRVTEKTRGVILTQPGNQQMIPIKAFYHSTCGGLTELPERVWGGQFPGFKRRVLCPFCSVSPRFRWELSLSEGEIADIFVQKIQDGLNPPNWRGPAILRLKQKKLIEIQMRRTAESERVSQVVTVWSDGKSKVELALPSFKFREWLGTTRLRSTSFEVSKETGFFGRGGWHFRGRGNGHGVGMCQWGAKIMGEKGYSVGAILKHYYPDAILRKLW
jgi:stage II sporulation protein D